MPSNDDVIVGQQDPEADAWLKLAEEDLSPSKVLDRITAASEKTLGRIPLVGTILAGLGVFAITVDQIRVYERELWIVFGAIGVAILASLIGNVAIPVRVRRSDPESIKRYYERLVRVRGLAAAVASLAITVAVAMALLTVVRVYQAEEINPRLSLDWTEPEGADHLAAAVAAGWLPADARATAILEGRSGDDRVEIARRSTNTGAAGAFNTAFEATPALHHEEYRLRFVVEGGGMEESVSEEIELLPKRQSTKRPHLSLDWAPGPETDALTVGVSVSHLPAGATTRVEVLGYEEGADGTAPPASSLFVGTGRVGSAGSLVVERTLELDRAFGNFRLMTRVNGNDGQALVDEDMMLSD